MIANGHAPRTPRVSVISAFHDRERTAAPSVRSILDQTFTDFEFIAIDDASDDGTLAVLRSFDDPRLRVIAHPTNRGFVRSMIDAIANARGEFVAVHGSGDISLPTRLERQVALLDARSDIGVAVCHRRNVAPDGTALSTVRPSAPSLTFDQLLKANAFSHGEVLYRRELYDVVGGYRPQFAYAQDRDLWLRLARITRFGVVPQVLYHRLVQADGVSFVPRKIVQQARYSQLAVELARSSPEAEAAMLRRFAEGGLDAVVPPDHPILRRRLLRKSVVLGVAGYWDAARELADFVPGGGPSATLIRSGVRALCAIGTRVDPDGLRLASVTRRMTRGKE